MLPLDNIVIRSVDEVLTLPKTKGEEYHMLKRKCYGISFAESGKLTYTLNGESFVSAPDRALIMPISREYTLHCDRPGTFDVINFYCNEGSFTTDTFHEIRLRNPESYIKDFYRLKQVFLSGNHHAKTLGIFYDIIDRLTREETQINRFLRRAIRQIEENFSDPKLTNTRLAEMGGISEVYLRKLFKQAFSVTPKQYILDYRMQFAKQYLSENLLSVAEVAERCGFSDVYHFSHIFKTKNGLTPKEYAKINRQTAL